METVPKIERRGGARPNSGPKPQTLSANQVLKMLRKARKWAKRHGKDVDDILLSFIYGDEVKPADRIACIKLWKEYTIAKMAEGGTTDKELGPAVFLPSQRPVLSFDKAVQAARQRVEGGKAA
jgi:hypothetical protein